MSALTPRILKNARIIYEPLQKEKVILIHEVGHRSEIYKKTKR